MHGRNLNYSGVIGILSRTTNEKLRTAIRNTWAKHTKYPIFFIIDKPSLLTLREHELNNDIAFINTTYTGRAVRFGDKLIRWFNFVLKSFSNVAWIAKTDDDIYMHTHQVFKLIKLHYSPLMYMGYRHHPGNRINANSRMDEAFVVIGIELATRLVSRRYCNNTSACDRDRDLHDTNYGGTSLGIWLSIYDDIYAVNINYVIDLQGSSFKKNVYIKNNLKHASQIYDEHRYLTNNHTL